MIEIDELAELMAVAAAADTRFPALTSTQDPRLAAWQQILTCRGEDAREAVMRIVRRPQMQVMQPGHILDEVKALRKERIKAVSEDALVPPDDLQPGRYPEWLRCVRRHIGDGQDVDYALEAADTELGVTRRLLGPSVRHELPKPGPRGMRATGQVLGETA